ncbi:adenosylmethionine--8-amino-7-oxononanoate transaminase [Fulvivirga lutea]|uniref:Adenosylmethionine-8-amino-7-oxononanoate aminotransferase n=1 Tax=Fulvivirga lutea TaxID=2810512 RepID=A0A974WFV9_9BACT|nr:adenosylmethionine--8-amino-7-oxononanoate transaminase [Fulvivirga lutea]QSE97275.1 adenosylmethionine--8-amino-7-oxononanoate transaminase [Fulvivirga lutea]
MNWVGRDKVSVWHPFTPLKGVDDPLMIKRAEGVYLITEDDRKIIDAISSWWVNIHGHAHPEITKAIAEQAASLEHVIFAGFTHQPAIELAENLLSILPSNQHKIFYSDNGSTAVEVALKMVIQYWYNKGTQKNKFIAIDGAYHGDTFGSMSVGERGDFTRPFFNHLFEVEFIDFPTPSNLNEVKKQFVEYLNTGEIAAFIFEPLVQGAAGMRMYDASFLDELITVAREHNVLCIADEVMTGFGRTGKLFASDYLVNKPDIFCLSKGLTGGALAMGVTSCTKEIEDAFQTPELKKAFLHGHSYTANPMACAAANASFKLLQKPKCAKGIELIHQCHLNFADSIKNKNIVKEVRVLGTILALEFKSDDDTSYFSEMRNQLYPFFISRNVLLRPLGNLIYILPPYIITEQQLNQVYSAITEFLTEHA